ncbi:uncharacterized protein EAF02_001583 [Botrytis sinoallii]|uniref:uncharacterized protein n=1 Tax=Botrytis sinoallii TaxID=1463999 RepID=UPI0018FF398C|nr:uncharacterized protein EAF02_001583 [Botrytis sinoallii]KAF7891258.1 hypothetical protein EAF02_001583 [Botrytis sinoallii]
MSGSGGGYYKYRCKYWLLYNCENWVWVNNESCAKCLASGRDETIVSASQLRMSREIFVPQIQDGNLYYTVMEIVALSDFDSGWIVKEPKSPEFPTTTSPTAESLPANDGAVSQVTREQILPAQKDTR